MSGTQWLRIRRLAECHGDIAVEEGGHGGFLYRPQELLVAAEDVPLVEEELRRYEPKQQDVPDELGVARFLLGRAVDVPELVERLRRSVDGRAPRVSVNHVLSGEPHY